MNTATTSKFLKTAAFTGVLGALLLLVKDEPNTPQCSQPAKISWMTGNASVREDFSLRAAWHHIQMLPKVSDMMVQYTMASN